ncbi:MAG: hypothetical protein GX567_10225, partial [Clostridia bacterium]|nr:hypothetical protein [Clostridia bacterium]
MKQIRDKKSKKVIVMGMMAAMIVIAALFLFWWKGAFLPGNLNWVQKEFPYFEGSVLLKNRELHLSDQNGKVLFQSSWDWCVQDVLSYDIDHDEK